MPRSIRSRLAHITANLSRGGSTGRPLLTLDLVGEMVCSHLFTVRTSVARLIGQRMIQGRWIGRGLFCSSWRVCRDRESGRQGFPESRRCSVQQVINGLQLGFVYALIALGYTMVYGIVRLINFAHGDVFMVGAFVSYFAISRFQLHLWPLAVFPGLIPTVAIADRHDYGDPALDGGLRPAGHHDRARRLQAAARCAAHLRPDHRHRRLVLPGIFRRAAISCSRPTSSPTSAPSRSVTWYINDGIHRSGSLAEPRRPTASLSPISLIIIVVTSLLLLVVLQFIVQPHQDRQSHAGRGLRQSRPPA